MYFTEDIDSILNHGIDLSADGIKNWALKKDEALEVVERCLEKQISILGGDVLDSFEGKLQYNYDNWYCNKENHETAQEFIERSNLKAKDYIQNYLKTDMIYFCLVLSKS